MNCPSCRSLMPKEAFACPNCGSLTDAEASESTMVSQSPASASYNSNPYSPSFYTSRPTDPYSQADSNPYSEQSNPYTQASSPPPSLKRSGKKKQMFMVGIALLLVIILGVTAFVWLQWQKSLPLQPGTAQALYNQTIHEAPSLDDPLTSPDNYAWDNNYPEMNAHCGFSHHTYEATAKPGYFSPCYAKATNYADFLFQARVTILSGHSAGLTFRAESTNDRGYQYRLSTDGTVILNKFTIDNDGQPQETTLVSAHTTLKKQSNILAVLAQGNALALFINGHYVGGTNDNTYQSGQIGVYVDSDTDSAEAAFGDIRTWLL